MPWGPAIDGASTGLKDVPLNLILQGKVNPSLRSFVLGTNKNEGSIFIPVFPLVVPGTSFPPTDADLPIMVEHALNMYPSNLVSNLTTQTIMAAYPPYANGNNWQRGSDLLTHFFFSCSARRTARATAALGIPTYLYQFSADLSNWLEYGSLGNYHMSELFFVWRNQWPPLLHDFNSDEWQLADTFSAYWGNYAYTGNPNQGPLQPSTVWPLYTAAGDANVQIEVPMNTTQHLLSSYCNMWDSVSASLNAAGRLPVTDPLARWGGANVKRKLL